MNISTVNELIASLESAGELSIRETKVMALAKAYQQLAAENVQIKAMNDCLSEELRGYESDGTFEGPKMHLLWWQVETPATDAYLAGIKADGRAEGINFAASRLAAAFNHGFVDKPMAEVGDVVRMILTAKEDLANDPALPADGLSGEYAEKSLAEWEAELREGADK
ncbi:hypothetical protein [Klebsiella pneumoniae]|uniref:hypothetical protein n=1 Tax=Klebsiella pneumoniae TaxID=573 RepID=UPI003F5F4551